MKSVEAALQLVRDVIGSEEIRYDAIESVLEAHTYLEEQRQLLVALAKKALADPEVLELLGDEQRKALKKLLKPSKKRDPREAYFFLQLTWRQAHYVQVVLSTSQSSRVKATYQRYFKAVSDNDPCPVFFAGWDILSDAPRAFREDEVPSLPKMLENAALLHKQTESWRMAGRPQGSKPDLLIERELLVDIPGHRHHMLRWLDMVAAAVELWAGVLLACKSLKTDALSPPPAKRRKIASEAPRSAKASSSRVLVEDLDAMEDVQPSDSPQYEDEEDEIEDSSGSEEGDEVMRDRSASPPASQPDEPPDEEPAKPETPAKLPRAKPKPSRQSDVFDADDDDFFLSESPKRSKNYHLPVLESPKAASSPGAAPAVTPTVRLSIDQPTQNGAIAMPPVVVAVIPPTSAVHSEPLEPEDTKPATHTSSGEISGLGTTQAYSSSQEQDMIDDTEPSPARIVITGAAEIEVVPPVNGVVRILAPSSQETLDRDISAILKSQPPRRTEPFRQTFTRPPIVGDDVAYEAPSGPILERLSTGARFFAPGMSGWRENPPALPDLDMPTYLEPDEVPDDDVVVPKRRQLPAEAPLAVRYEKAFDPNVLAAGARPPPMDSQLPMIEEGIRQSCEAYYARKAETARLMALIAPRPPSPASAAMSPSFDEDEDPDIKVEDAQLGYADGSELLHFGDIEDPLEEQDGLDLLAQRLLGATDAEGMHSVQQDLVTIDPQEVLSQGDRPSLDEESQSSSNTQSSDSYEADTTAFLLPPPGQQRTAASTSSADPLAPSRQAGYVISGTTDGSSFSSSGDLSHVALNNVEPPQNGSLETPLVSSQERFSYELALAGSTMDRESSQEDREATEAEIAAETFLEQERRY